MHFCMKGNVQFYAKCFKVCRRFFYMRSPSCVNKLAVWSAAATLYPLAASGDLQRAGKMSFKSMAEGRVGVDGADRRS